MTGTHGKVRVILRMYHSFLQIRLNPLPVESCEYEFERGETFGYPYYKCDTGCF